MFYAKTFDRSFSITDQLGNLNKTEKKEENNILHGYIGNTNCSASV